MASKSVTQWFPGSGNGYVVSQTGVNFQDNLGHTLQDNLGNILIPTPNYVIPKYATVWTVPVHS